MIDGKALSYYSYLMLSQYFQPMGARLSKKAVLLLAENIVKVSCWSGKTGPCCQAWGHHPILVTDRKYKEIQKVQKNNDVSRHI